MRVLKYSLIFAAGFCLLALLALGILFAMALKQDPTPRVVSTSILPADSVHVGEPIALTAVVKLPWYRRFIHEPDLRPGEERQVVGVPKVSISGIGFGEWSWQVSAKVQATGFASEGPVLMRLFFTADRQGQSEPLDIEFTFPAVVPRDLDDNRSLVSAEAVQAPPPEKNWNIWAVGGIILLLALVAAVLLAVFRSRGIIASPPPPPAPWEIAERSLQHLEDSLPMEADTFFQSLTDIVRLYIERRFSVPATEKTTPEFLTAVNASDWLTAKQRPRLQAFLTSADMVKFARAQATLEQMNDALKSAWQFLLDTRPQSSPTPAQPQPEDES